MINRAAHSRRGRRTLAAAAIAFLALAAASPAAAAESAVDEYSIDLPGVRDSRAPGDPRDQRPSSVNESAQSGVTGETAATGDPLDALGAALADNGPGLMAGAAILAALALGAHSRRLARR